MIHPILCMLDGKLRTCVLVLSFNFIFDTLQCFKQVCEGLRTNFGHAIFSCARCQLCIESLRDTASI